MGSGSAVEKKSRWVSIQWLKAGMVLVGLGGTVAAVEGLAGNNCRGVKAVVIVLVDGRRVLRSEMARLEVES
jgi:hypothetical protein